MVREGLYDPSSNVHGFPKHSHITTVKNIEKVKYLPLAVKKFDGNDKNYDETLVTTNSSTESTIQTQFTLDSKVNE